jgi:hypothetical protein
MKKIHVLGIALIATVAFGVVGAVSASAATVEWLAAGKTITAGEGPLASETTGSLTLGSTNGLGIGIKAAVLCVGVFIGTVGPGAEDLTTEVLNAALTSSLLSCVSVETCEGNSEVKAVDLPWLTIIKEDSSTEFLDVLESGGKGNPGWEIGCKTALGTVTETCTAASEGAVINNASPVVEGKFIKKVVATCTHGGANSGFVESSTTDAIGRTALINNQALTFEK